MGLRKASTIVFWWFLSSSSFPTLASQLLLKLAGVCSLLCAAFFVFITILWVANLGKTLSITYSSNLGHHCETFRTKVANNTTYVEEISYGKVCVCVCGYIS